MQETCYTYSMRIGIDGNEANVEKKVGISEYAYQLLSQFYKNEKIEFSIYLKNHPREDMPKERKGWKYIIVGPKKFWTQIGLPVYLFTHFPRPDIFFSPTHYAPRFSPVPTAISVMDVSYLRFPDLFAKKDLYQLVAWTGYSARHAKKIFTISESSKNDILKAYKKRPEDVIVTYPGIKQEGSLRMPDKKEIQEKFELSQEYILFVGTLQPRKNIERLIEAFSEVLKNKKYEHYQLVIVGKKGWLYEQILEAPKKFGISHAVKFLEFVSDTDLPALYTHAKLFILPSLYEGFGLPVVEAMKYGVPVITSEVSSLPEAGGDAAVYVDPENSESIVKAMEKVLGDSKLRADMIKKGYEHIKAFNWEKTAKTTLEVLEGMAEK